MHKNPSVMTSKSIQSTLLHNIHLILIHDLHMIVIYILSYCFINVKVDYKNTFKKRDENFVNSKALASFNIALSGLQAYCSKYIHWKCIGSKGLYYQRQ